MSYADAARFHDLERRLATLEALLGIKAAEDRPGTAYWAEERMAASIAPTEKTGDHTPAGLRQLPD
jgi:hypothetical protein